MKNIDAKITIAVAETQPKKKSDIFKTREGYKNVQVDIIKGVAIPPEDQPHIKGKSYCWSDKNDIREYYIMEVPDAQATLLNRDFECRKGEFRRDHRCQIWNKKRTKLIMCPFTNSCKKCPFFDNPDEVFPCKAKADAPLAYDEVNEDKLAVADESFGSAKSMDNNIEKDEMLAAILAAEGPGLYHFAALLDAGYPHEEIMDILRIDFEQLKAYTIKYINYKKEYVEE